MGARQLGGPRCRARREGGRGGRVARAQAAADDPLRKAAPQLLARPRLAPDDQPRARLARALDGDRGAAEGDRALPGTRMSEGLERAAEELNQALRERDAEVAVWRMDWQARVGEDDLSGPYVVSDVWLLADDGWRLRWRSWARLNAESLREELAG